MDRSASISDDCCIIEVFKERVSNLHLFGAGGFLKFNLVLQKLTDWNLWQITIISEAFCPGMVPEEVFFLENVEQIMIGQDRKMNNGELARGRHFNNSSRIGSTIVGYKVPNEF